jgi:transposase
MADLKFRPEIEILSASDAGRRRHWNEDEKLRIVEESFHGSRQSSATARRHGISRSLLTRWRSDYRAGLLGGRAGAQFVPVTFKPEVAVRAAPKADTGCQERIEIVLVNGRRVIVPATIDPDSLARLLPVLERT